MLNHDRSSPLIEYTVFRNNLGKNGGGLYNAYNSTPVVKNVIFKGNIAGVDGSGGIGGAVELVYSSNTKFYNVTFVDNDSTLKGGAMRVFASSAEVMNSIFWNNTSPGGSQVALDNGSINISYSDVQGGITDFYGSIPATTNFLNNMDIDPSFTGDDLFLSPSSPCIDAGNPSSSNIMEPDYPKGHINLGAYGNTPYAAVASDSDSDGINDGFDGCPSDPYKSDPGECGCGNPDIDYDDDGAIDCFNPDEDNDGLSDLYEDSNANGIVDSGETDPGDPDTDNDGVNDGLEVLLGTNPLIPDGETDSDGDGFSNAEEILCGSDPGDTESRCRKSLPWLMLLLE